jgi:GNAT superfamily N-acetyltransferase
MNPAFLALANLCLCTRLFCLFRDDVADARVWRLKAMVEVVVATMLFPVGGLWFAVVLTLAGFNYAGFRVERRHRRKDFARLLLGALELTVLSVWLSPRLGLGFRPELAAWAAALGEWTTLASFFSLFGSVRFQLVLFGLLLAANESNLVIRAMFDWLDLKPRSGAAGSAGMVDVGEFNRGRIIGMLERVLLYSFVLQAQYGAIGFILAAKAFTRFKALDDRPFAEYVLIGTLLSACLALANGGMVRWLLGQP